MSRNRRSGRSRSTASTVAIPFAASPTQLIQETSANMARSASRAMGSSSAMNAVTDTASLDRDRQRRREAFARVDDQSSTGPVQHGDPIAQSREPAAGGAFE